MGRFVFGDFVGAVVSPGVDDDGEVGEDVFGEDDSDEDFFSSCWSFFDGEASFSSFSSRFSTCC